MNPERLLQHFERLSEAPDAIPRLRRFILDLAVRGKLVEQDPDDEPAEELLKPLVQSKQQKGMQSRKGAQLQQLNDENGETPFQIPSNWLWLRIGTLFEVAGGIQKTPLRDQNHVIRCRPLDFQISPFVLQFLNSPAGTAIMQRLAITTSGLYSLSVGKIRQIEVPLPPLAEQHRIVARVDELMALCDQLEAQLTTTEADSRRLLEAMLHEALAPELEETA
jgi:type I restriction enzyme S subunit